MNIGLSWVEKDSIFATEEFTAQNTHHPKYIDLWELLRLIGRKLDKKNSTFDDNLSGLS